MKPWKKTALIYSLLWSALMVVVIIVGFIATGGQASAQKFGQGVGALLVIGVAGIWVIMYQRRGRQD